MNNIEILKRFFRIKKIPISKVYEHSILRDSFIIELNNESDMDKTIKLLNTKKFNPDEVDNNTIIIKPKKYTLENMMDDLDNELKRLSSSKIKIFLGGDCTDNSWRDEIIEMFPNISFIDPYDPNWEPDENIYDEIEDMLLSTYVIFYNGGEGTKKEKKLLSNLEYSFKEFDDLNKLKEFLRNVSNKKIKLAKDRIISPLIEQRDYDGRNQLEK